MTRLLYIADTSSAYYILDINAPYHPQPIRTVFTPLRSKAVCLFPPCASVEDADGQRWNSKYPTSWTMSSSSGTVCKPTPPMTSTFRMLIAPIRVGRHCCRSMPVSRPHRRCAAFLLRFRGQLQRSGHYRSRSQNTCSPFPTGDYLHTEYDIARCSLKLLESVLFSAHQDYVRRQIVYSLLEVGKRPSKLMTASDGACLGRLPRYPSSHRRPPSLRWP